MNLKDLIKDNVVEFAFYRKGYAYYQIMFENIKYRFSVPLSDVGDATLLNKDKAMIFMRYIRKAVESNELIKI